MSYRIKTVAALLGVPRNTLIAWERRYGAVCPDRTQSGHRRYSSEDIATLQAIVALMGEGLRISEAVEIVRGEPEKAPAEAGATRSLVEPLIKSLLAYDQDGAARVWRGAEGMSFQARIHDVVLPGLRLLGDGWTAGVVSVAQEHYASDFFRRQLMGMLLALDHGPIGGPRVVCACPDGESHELGLLSAAVLLALRGCRVVWLGASVPQTDLVGVVRELLPIRVVIAVTVRQDREALLSWVCALRRVLPMSAELVVGGASAGVLANDQVQGVRFCPDLRDLVG